MKHHKSYNNIQFHSNCTPEQAFKTVKCPQLLLGRCVQSAQRAKIRYSTHPKENIS